MYLLVSMSFKYGVDFFFKQNTAYDLRISDWSSDVCSSGLCNPNPLLQFRHAQRKGKLIKTGFILITRIVARPHPPARTKRPHGVRCARDHAENIGVVGRNRYN